MNIIMNVLSSSVIAVLLWQVHVNLGLAYGISFLTSIATTVMDYYNKKDALEKILEIAENRKVTVIEKDDDSTKH